MYYSKSTGGFYDPSIHSSIPRDAVEITTEKHRELIEGQSNGMIISANEFGEPILVNAPAPTPEEIQTAVIAARSSAYRNEADPLFFKSQRGESTQEEWLAKVAEIKARYPDGVMPTP